LLDWSQARLAEAGKVATKTLADFEGGHRAPYPRTLADIRAALEQAGVEFIPDDDRGGAGVRLRRSALQADEGRKPSELDATNDD